MPLLRFSALLICVFAGLVPNTNAQSSYQFSELPNAPYTSRHNDAFFRNYLSGWIVNGDGEIHHTADGGSSWTRQFFSPTSHFRSVGFISDEHGFAGNVGEGEFGTTDPVAIYETNDGGSNWAPVTNFNGPVPKGICGMYVVNESTVVAVGRVRGPAFFVRTTDGGATWTSTDMSAYADGLIDVYFTHPDTGFVAGLTNATHSLSSGVILKTTDGGQTWTKQHETSQVGEWIWKLSFPSRRVGYASIQRNSGGAPINFVKTTDGGETWTDMLFSESYYFVQGIGFINEQQGWIGGNSTSPVYTTSDGGLTWQPDGLHPRLNRMRFLGDSLGFGVGQSVYRIRRDPSTGPDAVERNGFRLSAAYPNPFSDRMTVHYELPAPGPVEVQIFDVTGRRIITLAEGQKGAGIYTVRWDGRTEDGSPAAGGLYFVTLRGSDIRQVNTRITQTVILSR